MCAQSQQLELMEQYSSAKADELHGKLDKLLTDSENVGVVVEEVRAFLDTNVKNALQEMHETVPDLLELKLADGTFAIEKILHGERLTREQIQDDRARLIQVSYEVGQ